MKPFQPKSGGTICIANSASASSPTLLDPTADQAVLYNSSATATAFWRCERVFTESDAGTSAVVASAGTNGDMPIPPGAQVRVTVAEGLHKFSVIASAADGFLYITPGRGN